MPDPVDPDDPAAAPAAETPGRVPPEANETTGLRAQSYSANFDNGVATLVVGEFASDIADVWLIDGKGELKPVDSYATEEAAQGATSVTVKAKTASGDATLQFFITV